MRPPREEEEGEKEEKSDAYTGLDYSILRQRKEGASGKKEEKSHFPECYLSRPAVPAAAIEKGGKTEKKPSWGP